ncbi:MAG: hypothetical protein U0230_25965 [Polyangiales bacterium]
MRSPLVTLAAAGLRACALVVPWLVCGLALAQPSPEDRARAADAYDRGVSAYLGRDYAAAARWFETAHRIAPSPVALAQAVRAHRRAGDLRRAGTLALRLEEQAGLSAPMESLAAETIADARQRYARIDIACATPCTLDVDGAAEEYTRLFVPARTDVVVTAVFPSGSRTERVRGNPGEVNVLSFEAPGAPADASAVASADAGAEPSGTSSDAALDAMSLEQRENPYRISRLRFFSRPRATFFAVLSGTVAIGGATIWSAVDQRSSEDDYQAAVDSGAPSDQIASLKTEHDRDVKRTHWLTGYSVIMVAATGIIAAFTDWTPHGDRRTEASIDASPRGASLSLTHRF